MPLPVTGQGAYVNRLKLVVAAALATTALACSPSNRGGTDSTQSTATSTKGGADLTGAGATFPYPIYSKWISEYAAKNGVKINYQSIGSGGGIKQLSEQTVDFGASDAPMTDAEMAGAKGGPIYHIPTVVGVVAIAYNVPEVTTPLKLTGPVLADIYLGKITKWNDSRIASLNAGATLPAKDILVVHRTEGSGTTFIFTDYLGSVSPAWKSGPGVGKEVQWPVGLGAKGNDGVAGQIKQTPGSIGYVELAYVKQNKLAAALLENADKQFVAPTAESATAAAEAAAAKLPANTDFRVSIVNAAGANTYPITSFTWLLLYQHMPDAAKAKKLADFVKWALTDGQSRVAALDYAPLPASLVSKLTPRLDSIGAGQVAGVAAR
jgi:phosphate transport system substrate-binding protein